MPRTNTNSLSLFLAKIALYARYGYQRYVVREIPEKKDLEAVDIKIMKCYEVTFNRWKRGQRKKQGLANVIYLRFKNTFVLLATEGKHDSFDKLDWKHLGEHPIIFSGYSIRVRNNHPSVEISKRRFKSVKRLTTEITLHNHGKVTRWLKSITPFQFKGINNQRWKLYRLVNKKRKAAGLPQIIWEEITPTKNHQKALLNNFFEPK